MMKEIRKYINDPAANVPYDPVYPEAAEYLASLIRKHLPGIVIHHVGSTSIPGCDGKGILDMAIVFNTSAELESIKECLAEMGFQKQTTRDPFPDDRPMRTGCFSFQNRSFQTHIHAIPTDSPEIGELLFFRDTLTGVPSAKAAYVNFKRKILSQGITDPVEYSERKGEFIREFLERRTT